MTSIEINCAVAEAMGWKWYRLPLNSANGRVYRCLFLPALIEDWDKRFVTADMTERLCNWEYQKRDGRVSEYDRDADAALGFAHMLGTVQGWRCVANMGQDGTWECFFTKTSGKTTLPQEGDHYGAGDNLAYAICEAGLRVLGKWKEIA